MNETRAQLDARELVGRFSERMRTDPTSMSLSPLLSLFRLNGEPMGLKFHFMLEPLYKLTTPRRFVLKTARQIGKSYGIASQGLLTGIMIPNFHTLYVQPRFDQIKFFSTMIVKTLINDSYVSDLILGPDVERNVLVRSFTNGSRMHFSFCLLDAERVRGLSGLAKVALDEVADIDASFIPVIGETMSASRKYGFYQFTGTPKTTDNTLNVLFEESSMGELVIPCRNCRKLNVPSISQDLLKMIGKTTCVCSSCEKPLDARDGWVEHANPAKRSTFEGLHLSQIIHPLHYTSPSKWAEILYKRDSYSTARFHNEILGEPCDEAAKLISVDDIRMAQNELDNKFETALKVRNEYETVVLGVDWSGGGSNELSYTTVAVVGVKIGTDRLDCLYAERFPLRISPVEEIRIVLEYASVFRASYIAHDFTGAGALREVLMREAGVEERKLAPFTYVHSVHQEVIKYNKPSIGNRHSWSIDKARSLVIMVNMIKAGKVTLPNFEASFDVTKDLLALMEEVREMPRGSDIHVVTRMPNKPDDFAHSLNLAASTIWHVKDSYPSLTDTERFKINADVKNMVDPAEVRWWDDDKKE